MTTLEMSLVALVSVWTVLFCLLGIAGFYLVRDIRRLITRVDRILESTQAMSEDVRAPFEALAVAVREVLSSKPKPAVPLTGATIGKSE